MMLSAVLLFLCGLALHVKAENFVVTLSAGKYLNETNDEVFYILGQDGVDSLGSDLGLSLAEIGQYRNDSIEWFKQYFGLEIPSSRNPDLSKKHFFWYNGLWIFSPFVFRPDLQYKITSHPNHKCVGTKVTASGYLVTSLTVSNLKGFGMMPSFTAMIYGLYKWHGTDQCDPTTVKAFNVLPVVLNKLGYRAEEYYAEHPKYGKGWSHVTAIDDKRTKRFSITTVMEFSNSK
jgi:hypothetical protein